MMRFAARICGISVVAIVSLATCGICESELQAAETEESQKGDVTTLPVTNSSHPLDRAGHPDIKIGAIRFDYWYRKSSFAPIFAHAEVNSRTPWFGEYELPLGRWNASLDDQWVMDRDVKDMEIAGLDWVAENWQQRPASAMAIVDSFASAVNKTSLSYALLIHVHQATKATYCKGASESLWESCRSDLIRKHFPRRAYLRVEGRPVVLLFAWAQWEAAWPSRDKALLEFDKLAEECAAAGLDHPYYILCTWSGHRAAFETLALRYGIDALSAYAHYSPEDGDQVSEAFPYQDAINMDAQWREDYSRNVLGLPVIPNVMTGWDPRAIWVEPTIAGKHYPHNNVDYYEHATPEEIVRNLDHAIDWLQQNPQEFMGVLIYAWNEVLEGGTLMETRQDGRARLEALQQYLSPN